jgi:hypothetical protein
VPAETLNRLVQDVHMGLCPKCKGSGPVDVHTSHRVWSAVYVTRWSSRPQVCCRSCGVKSKIADIFFSLFLGWWGFPFGFVLTPVQIVRNVAGLFASKDPYRPSAELEKMVRLGVASRMLAQSKQAAS